MSDERLVTTRPNPWKAEGIEVLRAVSGGLLFGVPLLYTMEMWWIGTHIQPQMMFVVLALLAVPLFALIRTSGFRSRRDVRTIDAVGDTVETMAIGIVVTAGVLLMLREVTLDMGFNTVLGKVVYQCVPFCLGIGVASILLADDPDMRSEDENDPARPDDSNVLNASAADVGATVVGATFVGLSIAPTDEIPMLASAMSPAGQLVMVAVSLVTSYAIVFVAGFSRQDRRHAQQGIFQRPGTETIVTYLVALVVALALLALFQRNVAASADLLTRVVVLGFPMTIGGAVGRLAL